MVARKSLGKSFLPAGRSPGQDLPVDQERWQQLTDFISNRDPQIVQQLLDNFFEETDEQLTALHQAIATEQWETIAQIAHAIKGSAPSFGASQLADLAQSLEQAARQAQAPTVQTLYEQLRQLSPQYQIQLNDRLHAQFPPFPSSQERKTRA